MAARPSPDEYGVPSKWVPVSGELARKRCLTALSETERLIFYNQDVLYHQNLEILQMLDELRGQHSNTSPKGTDSRHDQTRVTSEEAESKQKLIVEMPAPPVPSVRLPPVSNAEPLISLSTPSVSQGLSSTTNFPAIDTGSTSVTQSSPFTLARTNSLSGFAPMPATLLNPQELPPVVKVPSSQREWQERFNGLLGSKDKQGKREAEDSGSEEENGHSMASNPIREELFKRQKLEDASKSKDGNAVPGNLITFSPSSDNSNNESTDTTSLVPSSAVGFLASASKSEANVFGTFTPFRSSESTATACKGTASVAFEAYREKEGPGLAEFNQYQSITFMPEYREFSFEELQLADYAQGRRPAPVVTPEFFRQTKLSTASVSSISTLTTDGSGSISGLNAEGSPSPNLMANSPSKPEKRIFGGGQVGLPWWNSGTASGPGFSSGSIKTNSPSELGKFSVARAASGLQNQAPAQHTGFQVGSDHSLNSTTGMLSLGLIPLTDARTSPSNEAETAPQELPSTIRVRVMVAEPKRTPDVILPDCAVSSYYKTQTGDTKRRLLIINNDDGELLLDTALMKTVGFFKTLGGAAIQPSKDSILY